MKPKCKQPEQPNRKSLSQARLDRIVHPTDRWYRAYLHWFARMSGDRNRYPTAKLKAYYQDELGPLIAEIQMVVLFPPDDLPGETWELFEDEYQRLLGRAKAIQLVLEIRAKQPAVKESEHPNERLNGGSGSGSVSGKRPTTEPETDPFLP